MAATLYFLIYLVVKWDSTAVNLYPARLRDTGRYLKSILTIGFPSALQYALTVVAIAAQSQFVSRYTTEAIAALHETGEENMGLRTIMVFPEFENMDVIQRIRKEYDPLANLVQPHITLVFPFKSRMGKEELSDILERRLRTVRPFWLTLCGISKQTDQFGNYLFLNVRQGKAELSSVHQILYANEFQNFDSGLPYLPHMTIGKLPNKDLLEDAYSHVRSVNDTFNAVINKVSVEEIGQKGESVVILEKRLE